MTFFQSPVGEPLNDEAWLWYNNVVGGGKCTVVDTWWQTGKAGSSPSIEHKLNLGADTCTYIVCVSTCIAIVQLPSVFIHKGSIHE